MAQVKNITWRQCLNQLYNLKSKNLEGHLFENLDNIRNDKNTQKEILDFSKVKQISWGTLR